MPLFRTTTVLFVAAALGCAQDARKPAAKDKPVAQAFAIHDVRNQREKAGRPFLQFLNVPTMRMGLYALPAGGDDKQTPHEDDEVYYVLKGHATLRVESQEFPVEPGSMVFVPAHTVHKFHSISEPFETLVFFAATPRAAQR